jgi:hypothetical protein
MSDLRLRARSATETIDAAFQVYRRDPLPFVIATGVAYVPWLVLRVLLVGVTPEAVFTPDNLVASLLIAVGTWLSYAIMSAAVAKLTSDIYLGRPTDLASALRATLGHVGALLVASIARYALMMIGLILFVFPVFYVIARWFAVTQAIVLDDRGAGGAFGRSSALSRGRKGHILGTLALAVLIVFIGAMALGLITALSGSFVVQTALSTAYVIMAYPLIGITETLLYYDARIRGEGLDVEMMVDSLGAAPATEGAS